jgi:hypothetical protein
MPKKAIDYKKAMIYKICCNDLDVKDIYVGSTTEFTKRKNSHKSRYFVEDRKFKLYQCIRDNGGWDNWSMILIENYPCNNKIELTSRERYYIETLNATLNSIRPIVSKQEKQEETKVFLEKWRSNNKEKIAQYRIEHKEDAKKYNKEYHKKNKEMKTRRKICECGTFIQTRNKIRHLKSQLHKNLLSNPFVNFKL